MKIERRIIDDLKTERSDIAPPLPAYFRVVPVLFYLTILGAIALSAFYLFLLQNAAISEANWLAKTAERNQTLTRINNETSDVESRARRAGDLLSWVEGSRNLQPLVVEIIRSMEPNSSIAELSLTRDPATPTQMKLSLRLNTQGSRQLDLTLERITAMNFRPYSPNRTQSRGEIDYDATLIYQAPKLPEETSDTEGAGE